MHATSRLGPEHYISYHSRARIVKANITQKQERSAGWAVLDGLVHNAIAEQHMKRQRKGIGLQTRKMGMASKFLTWRVYEHTIGTENMAGLVYCWSLGACVCCWLP